MRGATATRPAVNRKVVVSKSNMKGVLSFGDNNLFPQQAREIVETSVTANECFITKTSFIVGNGFSNTALSERIVNSRGLTMDQVLEHAGGDMALMEAIAFHVQYNAFGEKTGATPLDIEFVRLMENEDGGPITHAAWCPFIDSVLYPRRRKEFTPINLYDPRPEIVQQQIAAAGGINKYKGQIFYGHVGMGSVLNTYRMPSYFLSSVKAMETDAELVDYDYYSVVNGFNESGIYKQIRKRRDVNYNPLTDPNSLESQLAGAQGADKVGAIIVLTGESPEELDAMGFDSFNSRSVSDRYNATNDRVPNKIATAWGIPQELMNIRRTGGIQPTGDELIRASNFAQWKVNRQQRFLERVFNEIYNGNWHKESPGQDADFEIENLDYFIKKGESMPRKATPVEV